MVNKNREVRIMPLGESGMVIGALQLVKPHHQTEVQILIDK